MKTKKFTYLKYPAFCVNCGNPAPYGGYCSMACQREVFGV